jgi:SAM-dependent methyltransferase
VPLRAACEDDGTARSSGHASPGRAVRRVISSSPDRGMRPARGQVDTLGPVDEVRATAERYSEDAAAYREHWAPLLRTLGARLLDGLSLGQARRVLDLGAGVGFLLAEARARAPRATVVGADRAPGMISLAPREYPRLVADASRLGLADGVFDAVTMAFMLFHLPDASAGLAEVRRVLRPGGALGVATWGEAEPFEAFDVWIEELDRHEAEADNPVPVNHDLMDTETKLADLLAGAGFDVEATTTVPVEERSDLEEFVTRRLRLGHPKRRLDALDADSRAMCIAGARARLERLDPEAFVDRTPAVMAWARRPA